MSSGTQHDKNFGQVKWFNNKSGYGFITLCNGEHAGTDIFVHHTDLNVSEEQYRYLITGEYVELVLSEIENKSSDATHKYKAVNVRGICGGPLMCEIKKTSREDSMDYKNRSNPRPVLDESTSRDWMVVKRRSNTHSRPER